jgi:hypothetical protein
MAVSRAGADVEHLAGFGVDERRGAVVATELDLPHQVSPLYVCNLQRSQVPLPGSLLGCGVDGVGKADLADRSLQRSSSGIFSLMLMTLPPS